jgi:ribosomal protein S20
VFATQSRAKGIIEAHRISKIKLVTGTSGQVLQYTGTGYNWGNNTGANNTAIGYKAGYVTAGTGLGIGNTVPNNTITFGNPSNPKVLVITQDGDVEWHGKPSEAAEALKRTFQFAVEDMKGVTKAARRRYYLKACQNILNKAEKMEHQEFLDFLQKQVYNKERKAIISALKGEQ